MPRTTPTKKKKKSRKKWAVKVLRGSPGKKGAQTQKNRSGSSYPGSLEDMKRLSKVAKSVSSSNRRLAFQDKLKKLKKGLSNELKNLNINESGNGDVVVKVNYTPPSSSSKKGGGKKKTKKKTHQKQTKHYKIEIIKKKPLIIQVYDYDKKRKEWVKQGKQTQIKKGGRRRKTKKRVRKKRTRKKN